MDTVKAPSTKIFEISSSWDDGEMLGEMNLHETA